MKNEVFLKILGIVFIIGGIFVIPFQYTGFVIGTIFDAICQEVIDFSPKNRLPRTYNRCDYLINYTINDKNYKKTFRKKHNYSSQIMKKGDPLNLAYQKKHPENSIEYKDKIIRLVIGPIFIIVGIFILIAGFKKDPEDEIKK